MRARCDHKGNGGVDEGARKQPNKNNVVERAATYSAPSEGNCVIYYILYDLLTILTARPLSLACPYYRAPSRVTGALRLDSCYGSDEFAHSLVLHVSHGQAESHD